MKNTLKLVVLVALALSGCGTPWIVIRQSPMPLQPSMPLAVVPTTFDGLFVGNKPEPEYLAGKKPEQQVAWNGDKNAFAAALASSVIEHGRPFDITGADGVPGRGLIESHVTMIEPGNFNGFVNIATQVRTQVLITDPNRQPLDEIELRCVVPASMYRPTVAQRVTDCGRATGHYLARYLRMRAGLK